MCTLLNKAIEAATHARLYSRKVLVLELMPYGIVVVVADCRSEVSVNCPAQIVHVI